MIAEIIAKALYIVAWSFICAMLMGTWVANTGGLQNLAAVWKRWISGAP